MSDFADQFRDPRREENGPDGHIRVFISHSFADLVLVEILVDLIRSALNLRAAEIRCTSVDGYRLPGGADVDDQLRLEVNDADAFIGVVSHRSMQSPYVMFELGARWGLRRHLIPLLVPGAPADLLGGPLAGLNALRADNPAQLHQLVQDLAEVLGIDAGSPASYEHSIERITQIEPSAVLPTVEPGPETESPMLPEESEKLDSAKFLRLFSADSCGATAA